MPNELFYAPAELEQACSLLADPELGAVALGGGTDLMVRFNRHRVRRQHPLVFLGKLGLDYIKEEGGKVVVGASAPISEVAASPLIKDKLPLLAKACGDIASPAVRNAATLGGNVVTNSRYGDGVAALIALGAEVVVASTTGERRLPMAEFASSTRKEKLAGGGVVKQFEITPLGSDEKWAWEKLRQRLGESRAILSVSLRAKLAGGQVDSLRLVLGGMAPNPFVSAVAAKTLVGKSPSADLIDQVAQEILSETDASSDARASAWYRQRAAQALVRQVLSTLA